MSENNIITKEKINIDNIKNIESVISDLKNEAKFASKVLDTGLNKMGNKLSELLSEFDKKIKTYEDLLIKQKEHEQVITNEFNSFALLPQKIENNIKKLVPDMATELGYVNTQRIQEASQKFITFQEELNKILDGQKETTSILLKELLSDQQAKLQSFTDNIIKGASKASELSRTRFLKNFFILSIFSIITAFITSYIITKYYPRFVEIVNNRDIIVHDSSIRITKTDPNVKYINK